jgi:PAS domain-containing protein
LSIVLNVKSQANATIVSQRAQAQQVQEIMNTVPQGVLLLEREGEIILANPIASSALEFLANADIGDTIQSLGNRSKTELLASPPEGLWHEIKAGRRIFEAIARPLINTMSPQQWVMVIREVTQEREIQQRVQQQERLAAVGQ